MALITPIPGMVAAAAQRRPLASRHQLVVIGLYPAIKVSPLVPEFLEQLERSLADRQFARHELVKPLDKRCATLWQDHTALKQHGPQLVVSLFDRHRRSRAHAAPAGFSA
ncbi:MAG: hypothetical protein U1E70_06470 [Acetobacteraceae bacterium]